MDGPPLSELPSPIADLSTVGAPVTPCKPTSSSSSSSSHEGGQFLGISPIVRFEVTEASPLPARCSQKVARSREFVVEQEPVSPIPVAIPAGRGVVGMVTPGGVVGSMQESRQATSTPNHQKQSKGERERERERERCQI